MNFPKINFRRAASANQILLDSLGKLERAVMREVWRRGRAAEVSVREVCDALETELAYTTVMTTLDRLHKKGLLARRKQSRAFVYSAAFSPAELQREIAGNVINHLLADTERQHVLSYFVESVGDRDRALLDELERLVQQKQRELENG